MKKQKSQHDKKSKDHQVFEGDRVFVFSPSERSGKAYKFAYPCKGPYHVMKMLPSGAELSLIVEPTKPTIRVAFNRLRHCPKEIVDGAAEKVLKESEDQMDTEEDTSKDLADIQEEEPESVVEVESAEPNVRSTRLEAGYRRDAITKDGDI